MILLIEDDEDISYLALIFFKEDGIDVETVKTSSGAIEILKVKMFDVVISDHNMEGMNGVEIFNHVTGF